MDQLTAIEIWQQPAVDEICPKCFIQLRIVDFNGTNPDDTRTGVICPQCGWFDED